MGPSIWGEDPPDPSYPGEDTRPTSHKETLGFYTYSFAAEVFVVCGLGAFIPITLEDLARGSATAVRADNHSLPCIAHGIQARTVLDPIHSLLLSRGDGAQPKGTQCVFRLLGWWEINTASFAMYTFSISVLIQALLVITMSAAADHGRYRKSLMVGFAVVGAVATMLYLPVTPDVYLLGSLWAIIGNVCFGASFVLLNSFLPLLVRWHPSVRPMQDGRSDEREWSGGHEVSIRDSLVIQLLASAFYLLLPTDDEPFYITNILTRPQYFPNPKHKQPC
jgi:UMF1 family MFS transporter